jgi:hypothetical protein
MGLLVRPLGGYGGDLLEGHLLDRRSAAFECV